ncbi:unnamed protein product [Enterobius vermicularis]|uniref:GDNF domain-containing protein n=1 Tax=Enterobius vermicularis TaxID=51028 RepID=A0A0N4VD20_ENTVE|nr:unnamed protein product [Enterobius vermicularis]
MNSVAYKRILKFFSCLLEKAAFERYAVYARIIYGYEFADRLWELPNGLNTLPELNTDSVCLIKFQEFGGRLFGDGISRISDSADLRLNSLNTSCLIDENEVRCYRRYLENDHDYQHLVANRDQALRSCIQSLRLRSECRNNDGSTMRACLCSAREEFENRLQASLIECVRKSGSMFSGSSQHKNILPNLSNLGTIINGQCLCACNTPSTAEYKFSSDQQNLDNFIHKVAEPISTLKQKSILQDRWEDSQLLQVNPLLLSSPRIK